MILCNKGANLQRSKTSASLEAAPQNTDNIEEENRGNIDQTDISTMPLEIPENEELVMWVWNNIITRDKMRRKSVAGFSPMVHFEKRKRYIAVKCHATK